MTVATDWVTISALATALGTLVLALATFASVRSANRAARVAERTLLAGLRPLLVPSRLDDPAQKVFFADQRYVRVEGGRAGFEIDEDAILMVISVRNAGAVDATDVHRTSGGVPSGVRCTNGSSTCPVSCTPT